MSGVDAVGRAQGPARGFGAPGTQLPAPNTGLLPPAEQPNIHQLQGSMAALYLAMGQLRDNQLSVSKSRIQAGDQAREGAEEERDAALARAREAAEGGGLFDWISKDIGLAGAVGLVTFNYALVAADVAAHKLDVVDNLKIDIVDIGAAATGRWDALAVDVLLRKTEIAPDEARNLLEKVGIPRNAPGLSDEDVKPVAKKLLLANLAIAGIAATVLSGGTTAGVCVALAGMAISAAGQQVAEHQLLDPVFGKGTSKWIGLGIQVGGAVTSGLTGSSQAATIIRGATTTLRGADQVIASVQTAKIDSANIDADSARMQLAKIDRLLEFLIDGIKESQKSHRKAAETLQGAIQTADQTQLALAQGTRV